MNILSSHSDVFAIAEATVAFDLRLTNQINLEFITRFVNLMQDLYAYGKKRTFSVLNFDIRWFG